MMDVDQNADNRVASSVCIDGEQISHLGFFSLKTIDLRHPTFSGLMSDRIQREVFVTSDAAIVLPYDARRDRVLLVEQFRMGPFVRGATRPWSIEPVAGRVDAGEAPENTAHREAEEEAGITLLGLEKIAGYYPTPGYSTEYFHSYLGLVDLPQLGGRIGGLADEGEDIKTHILDFAAAMELVTTGRAENGPLILSMLWLQRERSRLRAANATDAGSQ